MLAAVSVVLFLALVLAGWLTYREIQASQARVLVGKLSEADIGEVPRLLEEMKSYRGWTDKRLHRAIRDKPLKKSVHLRLSLALLDCANSPSEQDEQVQYLRQRLLKCSIPELVVICSRLRPFQADLIEPLEAVMRDPTRSATARFHATLALARYAPERVGAEAADLSFLTTQLLDCGRDDQRDIRSFLKPLRQQLLPHLKATFEDEKARTTVRLAAADALADLESDNPEFLAQLACEATLEQLDSFRPRLLEPANRDRVLAVLHQLVREQPPSWWPEDPVRIGKRRAAAAALLVLLGDNPSASNALSTTTNPESMTQLIHQIKERCAPIQLLLEGLANSSETHVRYALLLALGDYNLEELIPADQERWTRTLLDWYRHDPDGGVHSACGWLLRRWGLGHQTAEIDRLAIPYDPTGKRGWFTEQIAGQPWTFIVCRPGRFLMGSPGDERYRQEEESRKPVTIVQPFALSDRELTWAQAQEFLETLDSRPRKASAPVRVEAERRKPSGQPDGLRRSASTRTSGQGAAQPVTGLNYAEAILYCRWLTAQVHPDRPETYQCYDDPGVGSTKEAIEKVLRNSKVHPERLGFRLPTDAEWEYACRAGTTTAYSFGNDRELLKYYGWHLQEGSQPTALLRPNPWGLFDMHGNAWEWCQDGMLRGGGWDRCPWHCRSAYRHHPTLNYRANYMGFRVARTLP